MPLTCMKICEFIGCYTKKFIQKFCPVIFWIFYTKRTQYKGLKRIAGFFYGILLGVGFYNFVLVDLSFTPLLCLGLGTILCILIGLGNALSIQIRCITILTIPAMCGRGGRGVLKGLVLALVVSGPIKNLAFNGREIIRVFSCTSGLTFNLTKNRFDMMFRPFQEAILSLKGDTSSLKEAMNTVKDTIVPVAEEIEGEEEMRRIKEDNDYLDELHEDTKRSKELEEKYKAEVGESKESRVEKQYKKKLEEKCEGVLTRGAEKCRTMFASGYDKCYEKVTWLAAWLLCWPMKLTFVCNILQVTFSTPDRDSNIELPIIGNLVHFEISALDHVATEVGDVVYCELGRLNLEEVNPHLRGGRVENDLGKATPVHPTEIRTSISPSSTVELNTTSALYSFMIITLMGKALRKKHLRGNLPAFVWDVMGGNVLGKTTPSSPDRDSILDFPVIGSLVYCKSNTLEHAAIKAAIGGSKTCDPTQFLQPGFGEGYQHIKSSRRKMSEEMKAAKIQYKMVKLPPVETGFFLTLCQREAKHVKIGSYRVMAVLQLMEMTKENVGTSSMEVPQITPPLVHGAHQQLLRGLRYLQKPIASSMSPDLASADYFISRLVRTY
uniref:Uncharacterized protein n=1 Tax=Timema bartmani TaxID=61472 RepID=A0A7R9EXY2_9NEOP|nr:unnamed protein product [Timema bartmani]